MAGETKTRTKRKKAKPLKTFSVYVVELEKEVLSIPKFVKANPDHDPEKALHDNVELVPKILSSRFVGHGGAYQLSLNCCPWTGLLASKSMRRRLSVILTLYRPFGTSTANSPLSSATTTTFRGPMMSIRT